MTGDPQVSRKQALDLICTSAKRRGAVYAAQLDKVMSKIMKDRGVNSYEISRIALDEAMLGCGKDIEKMAVFQEDNIDPFKLIGYLAFWIRKIKPFRNASDNSSKPITDINERFSLWLVDELSHIQLSGRGDNQAANDVRTRFNRFFNDASYLAYVIHCMRNRTFGPHHYVIFLHKMVKGY